MRNIGAITILMIVLSPPILWVNSATAQNWSPSEQELWNLEKTYMTLLQEGNIKGLSEFWHQDFIGWPSHSSRPVDRNEGIVSLEALLVNMKSSSFTFHPQAIQIAGEVAIVHYEVEFEVENTEGEKKEDSYRVTHTWLKDNGNWRNLGGMSSKLNGH